MEWEYLWLLLFWSSSLIQLAGLFGAVWNLLHSHTPAWKSFWCGFLLNWIFTLIHQAFVGLFPPDPFSHTALCLGVMKLGAMVSEIFIMLMAQRLQDC